MKSENIKIPAFSLGRVSTIATGTVTQLVRMKTFYFLLVFALLVVAVGNLDVHLSTPARQLELIKKVSFGTMDLFAWLFAIVATALLIPRDLEDRTLYTILSKPVRRIEYLCGKLLGVLILVGFALAVMFTLCMIMLYMRQMIFIGAEVEALKGDPRATVAEIEQQVALIEKQGARPQLAVAALASFLKASVVAAMTILISTFASSSLFTIISSILFFLIGHAHNMASNFWIGKTGGSLIGRLITNVVKLLIPDYQLFSFSEGIVLGEAIVPHLVWSMLLLTSGYLVVFLLISLIVFLYKEF